MEGHNGATLKKVAVVFGYRNISQRGPILGISVVRISTLSMFLILVLTSSQAAKAQEPTVHQEFRQEIDVYVHVKPKVRLYLIATVSKSVEDGELRNAEGFEAQIGAHIDYIPNEHVILRAGYCFGTLTGETAEPFKEHRLLTEQTLRKLLPGTLLLSDRNRQDFRLSTEFLFSLS